MADFVELLATNEQFRLAFVYVAGILVTIPAGILHKLLDEAPDWAIRPELTTTLFAPLVTLLGYGLAFAIGLPGEYGGYIGAIGGVGSGTAAKAMGSVPTTNPPASPGGE